MKVHVFPDLKIKTHPRWDDESSKTPPQNTPATAPEIPSDKPTCGAGSDKPAHAHYRGEPFIVPIMWLRLGYDHG
jgi:hypothetical protein